MDFSPTRLLCPGAFSGKNTEVDCHLLLQEIFPTQGLNPCRLHWQADSLPLSNQEGLPFTLKIHKMETAKRRLSLTQAVCRARLTRGSLYHFNISYPLVFDKIFFNSDFHLSHVNIPLYFNLCSENIMFLFLSFLNIVRFYYFGPSKSLNKRLVLLSYKSHCQKKSSSVLQMPYFLWFYVSLISSFSNAPRPNLL